MKTIYAKDIANKKLHVTREFDAPVEITWRAWTEKELLDQWWAPKPWKAETKTQDFKEGGTWIYCMVGPEGERHWSRADYKKIIPQKMYEGLDGFCDETGKLNPELPRTDWKVEFFPTPAGTRVEISLTYASDKDIETMLNMGFEGGFDMGMNNLDELLKNIK